MKWFWIPLLFYFLFSLIPVREEEDNRWTKARPHKKPTQTLGKRISLFLRRKRRKRKNICS
jgi:hypothetical protein